MPIQRTDYPPDWQAIASLVKTEADWKCEWCQAPHGATIRRDGDTWTILEYIHETTGDKVHVDSLSVNRRKYHGLTKVVITTAHLDRNTQNNRRENLAALCQKCHLSYDIRQHVANRKYGRRHAKNHQLKFF